MLSHPSVDANLPDKHGQTPLHVAAMNGTVDILAELLKRKDVEVNRYALSQDEMIYGVTYLVG